MRKLVVAALALVLIAYAARPAVAMHKLSKNWSVVQGIGLQYRPEYEGSDDFEVAPLPLFDISWRDRLFLNSREGLGVNLLVGRNHKIGVRALLDFGRDEDESDDLRGLGDVDTSLELGGYAEYFFEYYRFHGSVRRGVTSGHEGLVVDLGVQFGARLKNRKTVVLIGPTVTWASDDYMTAYFGVNPGQSSRSGLPQFTPDAGLKNVALAVEVIQPIWKRISMVAQVRFNHLLDDASDSPVVKKESQFEAGLGFTYRF